MRITVLTLFPQMFSGPFSESIVKRAIEKKLLDISFVDIRDFGIGAHKVVDDKPYGGGIGMVLRVDVLHNAIQKALDPKLFKDQQKVILMDARGKRFVQAKAREYSKLKHLIIVCAHYEGVDERVLEFVDECVSIGDFVLTGGEIPAMLVVDAVSRLVEGVLKSDATILESFSNDTLEHPQYTRPPEYNGKKVPDILISGDHKKIEEWKKVNSKKVE